MNEHICLSYQSVLVRMIELATQIESGNRKIPSDEMVQQHLEC